MKKYIALFICISFIFMLSCGNPADTDTNATANPPADNGNAGEAASSNENIFGAISEIVGNMATINLAVMPETGMPVPMNRPEFNLDNIDPDSLPEGVEINEDGSISINGNEVKMGEGAANFGGGGAVMFGGELPEGFDPGSMGEGFDPENMPEGFMTRRADGEGGGATMRGAMGSMLFDYTGEEKEFIIPVGLPIYALTRDIGGVETETEIELEDIKAGNAISVTYKADGKTVDKIIISQITAMNPSEVEEMKERISEFNNGEMNINNNNTDNNTVDNNAENGGN